MKNFPKLSESAEELLSACLELIEAYNAGEDSGSINWENLDCAYRAALEAVNKAKGN